MNNLLSQDYIWVSTAVALAAGLSAALVAWLISKAFASVPFEDRTYKDRPPLGFRLSWWPIQWVSYYVDRLAPQGWQQATRTRLRKAGLEYSITAGQFIAGRLLCAAFVALLFWWVIGTLDRQGSMRPSTMVQILLAAGLFGWFYPIIWLKDRLNSRIKELLKSLPFYLDIITLCVEAGLNMQGAMNQAVIKGPKGALRDEFQRVLRDIRAGKSRAVSLRDMADRLGEATVSNFVAAVVQAENTGMNLGPILRAQADQRRIERFLRAEKLAMEAPVKMLMPLIAFIFPCTFIVLFFPIAMKFMNSGI